MKEIKPILDRIKESVAITAPGSTIILYGSFARGDNHKESDLDILILVEMDKIDWESGKQIRYPLYDIEFETGQLISPMVKPKREWYGKYRATPFFQNVTTDGIVL